MSKSSWWTDSRCLCVYTSHKWTIIQISQRGKWDEAIGTTWVNMSVTVLTCICAFVVCLLRTHAQPHWQLELSPRNCSSLTSTGLLDWATCKIFKGELGKIACKQKIANWPNEYSFLLCVRILLLAVGIFLVKSKHLANVGFLRECWWLRLKVSDAFIQDQRKFSHLMKML